MQNVTFAHNFGGRASATQFASVHIAASTGAILSTIVLPSEFRVREDGSVTVYSRKHPSTSVYGVRKAGRIFMGITRKGDVHTLNL